MLALLPVDRLHTGWRFYVFQTYALFVKRYIQTKRSWFVLMAQMLVPAVFVVVTVLNERSNRKVDNLPPLQIRLSMYDRTAVVLRENQAPTDANKK